ncbi:hypothetical protein ACFC09_09535 [Streptomyces sp. NPDC056161]|uniref:hypothetical protein n=1 Tax=Streptomyces sp. NPDC056161 TaxID=3345732 RepID=UPI0035D8875C
MPLPSPVLHPRRERPSGVFDDAFDDSGLIAARTALAQGRRQTVRALLQRTGDDWDRRGHRICVLARESYTSAWARDWLAAEPASADAAVLLALALVRRTLRGKAEPARARAACRAAAVLAPADPTPWLGLLHLARHLGTDQETADAFAEVCHRHPEHHQAHHLMTARLAEHRPEHADPGHEAYAFAGRSAARAPADSPLAILPVVAYAERYRVLAAAGLLPADPAASGHWSGPRPEQVLRAAFDWWLEWEQDEHPRRHVDLNFLAHATFCAGHAAEAAVLFQRIGRHLTPQPWCYPDRDPCTAFRAARERALGAARSASDEALPEPYAYGRARRT